MKVDVHIKTANLDITYSRVVRQQGNLPTIGKTIKLLLISVLINIISYTFIFRFKEVIVVQDCFVGFLSFSTCKAK